MLQNKIYQNFLLEIFKTFFNDIIRSFSNCFDCKGCKFFLDLIVENNYPVSIYFSYSLLNLFGIAPKFVPLAFLLSLIIFIIKHVQDSEFIILWTSGVKKIQVVNLFLLTSIIALIFYLILSTLVTPIALNKSRQLLSNDNLNSFLPTIKTQQFSDSFKGFTFLVEKKINNQMQNIFLHDKGNNIKNLSSNISSTDTTTIIAEVGVVDEKRMMLLNGQIISTKKDADNEIITFEQLSIDLSNLSTNTIKQPKIQETSTLKLLKCLSAVEKENKFCNDKFKKEIIPTLNRRIITPFYIPVLSLVCGLLLIRSKKIYFNKISIFIYSFIVLLFTELVVRYTGLNKTLMIMFILIPFMLIIIFYIYLIYRFKRETRFT